MDGLGSAAGEGPILTQEAIGRQQPEIGVPRELFVLVHKVQLVVRVGQLVALAVALGRGHGRRRRRRRTREEREAEERAGAGWPTRLGRRREGGGGGRGRAPGFYTPHPPTTGGGGRGKKKTGRSPFPRRPRRRRHARDRSSAPVAKRRSGEEPRGEKKEAGRRPLRLECQRSVRSEGKPRRKKAEDKAAAPLRSKMSRLRRSKDDRLERTIWRPNREPRLAPKNASCLGAALPPRGNLRGLAPSPDAGDSKKRQSSPPAAAEKARREERVARQRVAPENVLYSGPPARKTKEGRRSDSGPVRQAATVALGLGRFPPPPPPFEGDVRRGNAIRSLI